MSGEKMSNGWTATPKPLFLRQNINGLMCLFCNSFLGMPIIALQIHSVFATLALLCGFIKEI